MKRIRTKEIILYVLGILFCKVEIADCYPLIPAYFTALYISMESRWLTLGACFVGMACFLPVTQLTKYGVAMAGIILIIHLIEWVDKNCRARYAAVTAGAVTTLISLGGNLLSVKGRGYITTCYIRRNFYICSRQFRVPCATYAAAWQRDHGDRKRRRSERATSIKLCRIVQRTV